MAGLNMGIIEAMPIPTPPIDIQRSFAIRVATVERLKATHRGSLAELDALFASLQHRAFQGGVNTFDFRHPTFDFGDHRAFRGEL